MKYNFLRRIGERLRGPGKPLVIAGSLVLTAVVFIIAGIITHYLITRMSLH
jgi:hypothetical protein